MLLFLIFHTSFTNFTASKYFSVKIQNADITATLIHITGLVQGVGFRPFVFRIAQECNLKGWVENRNDGVKIKAEGTSYQIDSFLQLLFNTAPDASCIESVDARPSYVENISDFTIKKSENISDEITEVSPDIAICDACLFDLKTQKHRINYPFINCTNCGPRFSIIKGLPYDRAQTTMDVFPMCKECNSEYINVMDRRFHAQPVACTSCGPRYELHFNNEINQNIDEIIIKTAALIDTGKIIAIKASGGFHFAVDAMNNESVQRLRDLKNRESKPFAVMFSSIAEIKKNAELSKVEEKLLASWRRPIVLLKENKNNNLSPSVCIGLHTMGCFLPYLPFHYLLFEKLKTTALVLTSGNISDEPIVIENSEAEKKLNPISDALLFYNRDIYNRTDDSVAIVINNKPRIVRRSRGYVPGSVTLLINVDGIFAAGAELKNTFCIGKGKKAIISQHIGDLKNIETLDFFEESAKRFFKLFRVEPKIFACDLHPNYLSTRYVQNLTNTPFYVQHHHAHIASCMAEHGLDEKVIGVCFDGTGYGSDGNIWGGEFFICDLKDFNRFSHFEYIPLPGGDKAIDEPWRMLASYLFHIVGKEKFKEICSIYLHEISDEKINLLVTAIEKNINILQCSSAGRLFDAVAALVIGTHFAGFEAEGPIRLESIIDPDENSKYNYDLLNVVSFKKTFLGIIDDMNLNIPASKISAKFHNTIVDVILQVALKIRNETEIVKVVLSGGTFQNRYILEQTEIELSKNNFEVYSHEKIPTNDGGISLGQLIVAAKNREMLNI